MLNERLFNASILVPNGGGLDFMREVYLDSNTKRTSRMETVTIALLYFFKNLFYNFFILCSSFIR
jgi:hypothetical protein